MTQVKNKDYTINVPVKVTYETLYDIMFGAICHGSTYWLHDVLDENNKGVDIETILQEGFISRFYYPLDDNDEEFDFKAFTVSMLIKGVEMYCSQFGDCIEDGEVDSCSLGSVECDLILQYALFGEQVYG